MRSKHTLNNFFFIIITPNHFIISWPNWGIKLNGHGFHTQSKGSALVENAEFKACFDSLNRSVNAILPVITHDYIYVSLTMHIYNCIL